MARVTNWHLGREADYPYEASRPKRQWAIVFDLNKCIACQTCSLACKTTWTSGKGQEYMFWNNVETKPYGSYPLAWDVRVLEALGPQEWKAGTPYAGKTIFEAASPEECTSTRPTRTGCTRTPARTTAPAP
jgi:nitrate reductase / nitrite oxidoreductase, beta subunit